MNKFKFLLYLLVTFIVIQKCFAVLGEALFLNNQNLTDNRTGVGLDNQNTLVINAPFKLAAYDKDTTPADEFNQNFPDTDFDSLVTHKEINFEKLKRIGLFAVKIVNKHIIYSSTRMEMDGTYSEDDFNKVVNNLKIMRSLTPLPDSNPLNNDLMEERVLLSLVTQYGNCGEMAISGGYLMKQMGVKTQIDLMRHDPDHGFLKVHSTPILYVDPWGNRVFTEDKLHQNLREVERVDYDENIPLKKSATFEKPKKSSFWKNIINEEYRQLKFY